MRAKTALCLLAVDPAGLAGLWLRARAGPVRDTLMAGLGVIALPQRRMHPEIGDDALFGGLDLVATLQAGVPVVSAGMLARPSLLVLAMAERSGAGLAARLGRALDTPAHCVLAVDEGADADETLPAALRDRLGLFVDLNAVIWSDTGDLALDRAAIDAARLRLADVKTPKDAVAALTRDLGNPVTLSALGANEADLPSLAKAAFDDVCAGGNPRSASVDEIEALYRSIL